MASTLHLGQTLSFTASPFSEGPAAARHDSAGALLVEGGVIREIGSAEALRAAHPAAQVVDHGKALIVPGLSMPTPITRRPR